MSDIRVLQLQDCRVDLDANEVRSGDECSVLSPQEVGILEILLAAEGRTVTQQELYREVWGYRGTPQGRAATFAVFRLRKKLERDPAQPVHLLTVRGKGFRLVGVQVQGERLPPRAVPVTDPPEASSSTVIARSNLVEPDSAFIGREESLLRIAEGLGDVGVVTLVGPAGTGKTRLAQRAAARELESNRWPGGVWFCDLVECRELADVLRVVEAALGTKSLSEREDADRTRTLGDALAQRAQSLIVLDNCEQVLAAVGTVLDVWVLSAPDCRFLTTSQEALRMPGERVLRIHPLDSEEGVALFLERAQSVRPGLQLTDEDQATLREIVEELDGLPLALELAAGRSRMMSLRQLRERLDRRFDLLRGRERGALSKAATLRGALDWSWELLTDCERAVWVQCTVFRGGFTCEAAEAVVDVSAHADSPWVVDVLEELLEKSLLVIEEDDHEPRFRQLLSVREYGQEHLEAMSSEERTGLHQRHANHYARLGAETELEALHRRGGVGLRQQRLRELDNLLQACHWAVENQAGPVAARATLAAMDLIELRGPLALAETLVDGALGLRELPVPLAARLQLGRARAHRLAGRLDEAMSDVERAVELGEQSGLRRLRGRALGLRGRIHQRAGRMDEAASSFRGALEIHRMEGDRRAEAERLGQRGMLHLYREELDHAQADLEESLSIHRAQGNRVGEGSILGNLAILHNARGDLERARQLSEEALELAREVGNRRVEAVLMNNLGLLLSEQGGGARAEALFGASIDLAEAIGDTLQQGLAMGNLANHHSAQGQPESALRCYLRGLELDRRAGNRRGECVTLGNLGDFYVGRGELDSAMESLDESLQIAQSLGYRTAQGAFGSTRALGLALQGRTQEASEAIAESLLHLAAAGNPGESFKARCIELRVRALAGDEIGPDRDGLQADLEAMGEGSPQALRRALERIGRD